VRFAERPWLFGLFVALSVALLLVLGAMRQNRALARFLSPERHDSLVTDRPAIRRMLSAILLVSAVSLAFLAAAAPQYGNGTRILPRTNLDVVLVLDYSKSMFARDVSPSRIERSKIEVSRLIQRLGGARFGAVAYAGEPMAFPLTSDGSAIAQFFRGLTPHDMPIGGTATARALEAGRQLLLRDPLSKNHEKVLVVITDGEDLEGDPKAAAEAAHGDGITVHVVQIGGRSPEPIPDVDEHGQVKGFRKDSKGAPLTTYLTPEGEKQLDDVASVGGGLVVRAGQGDTGIDKMADSLRKLMSEELTERVETVYADVFQYPLAAAVVLLLLDAWIQLGKRRIRAPEPPIEKMPRRKTRRLMHAAWLALLGLGCEPYDRLFERDSPAVEEAKAALQAGDGKRATEILTQYLESGECQEGVIGFGAKSKAYPNATFDLGLAFAGPGKPEENQATPSQPNAAAPPIAGLGLPGDPNGSGAIPPGNNPSPGPGSPPPPNPELDCALRLLSPLAENEGESAALRARALYLMGQVEMKKGEFEAAAEAYTRGLRFVPAEPEGKGDALGRDLAFNRSIALRRALEKQEEEKKKQDQDKKDQDKKDQDKKDQDKKDQDQDKKDQDQDKKDQGQDKKDQDQDKKDQDQDKKDQDQDKKDQPEPTKPQESGEKQTEPEPQNDGATEEHPPEERRSPQISQDDRILDQLEETPTLQEQTAKKRARGSRGRVLEDK
jgi:Ca-activated chloride channel homolog